MVRTTHESCADIFFKVLNRQNFAFASMLFYDIDCYIEIKFGIAIIDTNCSKNG